MADDKRLIYASPVYEDLRKSYEELQSIRETLSQHEDIQICNGQLTTFLEALLRIKNAPTVDAVEVVHAKAVPIYSNIEYEETLIRMDSQCPVCGALMLKVDNYCPNCGAKMDGGNEDV